MTTHPTSPEKQAQAQNLVATGQKARAMILKVQPTGMIVNESNIQCLVDFQLTPPSGGAPFQGQKKMMINQTAMPRVGDVWACWYDAVDPTLSAWACPTGCPRSRSPCSASSGSRTRWTSSSSPG